MKTYIETLKDAVLTATDDKQLVAAHGEYNAFVEFNSHLHTLKLKKERTDA